MFGLDQALASWGSWMLTTSSDMSIIPVQRPVRQSSYQSHNGLKIGIANGYALTTMDFRNQFGFFRSGKRRENTLPKDRGFVTDIVGISFLLTWVLA